jgi:hypothetical protein
MPSWKEISRIIGALLLLGVIVFNLYEGTAILTSLFRGIVAFLVFNIINIVVSNIIAKILNDFEYRRLQEIIALEEAEEKARLEEEQLLQMEQEGLDDE